MNRKVLSIIAAVVILGLGVVLAINYGGSSENKDSANNVESTVDENNYEKKNEDKVDGEDLVEVDENEIAIGNLAPDFTLKNLEGEEVSLSDYRGKIVLINFWATWCKFCDIEMPDLDALDKENEDVVVLAVDVNEEASKVKTYIEKGGYEFEVALDSDGAISRQYLVSAFPTTYAVDKEGILMGGVPGMMTKPQMEQIVESVRAGQ